MGGKDYCPDISMYSSFRQLDILQNLQKTSYYLTLYGTGSLRLDYHSFVNTETWLGIRRAWPVATAICNVAREPVCSAFIPGLSKSACSSLQPYSVCRFMCTTSAAAASSREGRGVRRRP
jgi:hypothetical protein